MKKVSKYFALVLIMLIANFIDAFAQTYVVKGVISVSKIPVRYASVTFVDNSDTTKKFSAITDTSGNYQVSVVVTSVNSKKELPSSFELEQNYPNPFSSSTAISYKLNQRADAKVTIYDILGREIRTFNIGFQATGAHSVIWNGRNDFGNMAAPGVYFYRLQASGETLVKKMVFGVGEKNISVLIHGALSAKASEIQERSPESVQVKSFTVWVRNTEKTSPAITPEQVGSVVVNSNATFNFAVSVRSLAVVYLDSTHQIIRGFGGQNMPGWTDVGDLTPDQVQKAFGTEEGQIGMTILRIRVPYDSTQFNLEVSTAVLAKSLGAIIMATPWSPPPSLKSNDSIVGGKLNPGSYAAFANYLHSFADYMSENGAPLYAISVQNEPDVHVGYESCDWDATQMLNFVKNNAPAIGTRIIAPESYKFDHAVSDPILNDSVACANLSIVGGHLYSDNALQSYPLAISKGKELWMTEHIVSCYGWPDAFPVAQEINDCMNADMSAYLLWYIRRGYGPINDNGSVNKGGYLMAQYSKFVRPGFYRVTAAVDPPRSDIEMTAYKSGSKVVIVVLNKNSMIEQTFTIPNGTPTSFTPYVTSASKNCQKGSLITVSNGSFTATLDQMSVTTFVSN
jgi:glucuronoarabinoxylan endo-1,4-beta-xylanase